MGLLYRLLKGKQPPWYRWMERQLAPVQGLVVVLLVITIAITGLIAWKGPNWLRTAWLVYLLAP